MQRRRLISNHEWKTFHAQIHGAKMPSLEEILGVQSEANEFDKKTAELLEKRALELLEKRRNEHGR
jgi:hypothetical protein